MNFGIYGNKNVNSATGYEIMQQADHNRLPAPLLSGNKKKICLFVTIQHFFSVLCYRSVNIPKAMYSLFTPVFSSSVAS